MSTTYLQVVNDILSEMNEVLLTSTTFPSARNVQHSVKEMVNRAYMDINNPIHRWPWLSAAHSTEDFYGNVYILTEPGKRWYNFNDSATDINDEYGQVDWDNFFLTEEGVDGEEPPYITRNLPYFEIAEWRKWYAVGEQQDTANPVNWSTPTRVIRSPDNRRFGLSPIPDKEYRVYFYAWNRPVPLQYWNDTINLPDQYRSVLIARTRYYAWQRKEQPQQAAIALEEYKEGLRGMFKQEQRPAPNRFTDDRVRF